jgi:hypothetical protein
MKFLLLIVVVVILGIILWKTSQNEYFGEFKSKLEGEFIDAEVRPRFRLSNQFEFEDPNGFIWSVPADTLVDGASIPPPFWSFIGGPFSGRYIKASVIHDYYCDEKTRTEHDTHRNFYYGMRANKVTEWKAKFMYWAVATFGPKWKLENNKIVQIESVDLDNPEIRAIALSKASAVARSLKTSKGEILDVSMDGEVESTLENISRNSENYRTILLDRSYLREPEKLGVLSGVSVKKLDDVAGWKDNKIPEFRNTVILKQDNLNRIRGGEQFRMNTTGFELMRNEINRERSVDQ